VRAVANLQKVEITAATYVNVYDILNADHIIVTADAVKAIETWLKPAAKKVEAK
ncbi:50S ribosomal protein L4, partial [Candidatus Saccharibacteria bacterium]|nr:50S ribosomal protein L4 [Candidatus Saccharibacteria bacterium]